MKPFRHSLVLLLLLTVSCVRPSSEEFFVRTADRDEAGRYCFQVDFSDSTLVYGLDLLVCMSCDDLRFSRFRQMPLRVRWTAPSGRQFEEAVWVSRDDLSGETYYNKNFWVPYRRDMRPTETGEWSLALVLPEDAVEKYEFLGTGVRLIREKD